MSACARRSRQAPRSGEVPVQVHSSRYLLPKTEKKKIFSRLSCLPLRKGENSERGGRRAHHAGVTWAAVEASLPQLQAGHTGLLTGGRVCPPSPGAERSSVTCRGGGRQGVRASGRKLGAASLSDDATLDSGTGGAAWGHRVRPVAGSPGPEPVGRGLRRPPGCGETAGQHPLLVSCLGVRGNGGGRWEHTGQGGEARVAGAKPQEPPCRVL